MTTARHELTIRTYTTNPGPWYVAECTCLSWRSQGDVHDQLLEDYQTHRDVIDEAARFESQRLDDAVAHAVNMGAK